VKMRYLWCGTGNMLEELGGGEGGGEEGGVCSQREKDCYECFCYDTVRAAALYLPVNVPRMSYKCARNALQMFPNVLQMFPECPVNVPRM
jgi:hypothetical protein